VQEEPVPGSILFITSTHTDLTLNRALLTLWMDLAVNALMGMPRTRDLRMWYLFDEVHALHRMPAIEHGLQTARGFGGAFVLGMHSFDKLAETYGEEGAINLASLARTKLILATADKNTAEVARTSSASARCGRRMRPIRSARADRAMRRRLRRAPRSSRSSSPTTS
jgi:type IV secretory pathway TraG/TraD family ATPase VirD4